MKTNKAVIALLLASTANAQQDADNWGEDQWRQFFDDNGGAGYGWINQTEFGNAWRSLEPDVSDETIQGGWDAGDTNTDGQLSWDEFWTLIQSLEGGDQGEDGAENWGEDQWRQFFDDIGGAGYGWINQTEFGNGWRQMEPDVTDEAIAEGWNAGDTNMDGQLSWDEFWTLVLSMEGGDHGEDDVDNWTEDQWRQFFDDIGAAGYGWINKTEFGNGYRSKDPDVTDEQIDEAWNMADTNEDGQMNWDEFWALVNMMKDGDSDPNDKMNWGEDQWRQYFDDIGAAGYGWISKTEFETAWRAEEPLVTQEQVDEAWAAGDMDQNDQLNWDEFWMLAQMKMEEMQTGDPRMYWGRDEWAVYFDSIGAAGYGWISKGEFETAYRAEEPDVDQETMDYYWNMGDSNGDNQMNFDEFMNLMDIAYGRTEGEEEWSKDRWFDYFQANGGEGYGWINFGEFSNAYRGRDPNATDEDIQSAWDAGDNNADGQMSWDEFWLLVSQGGKSEEEWLQLFNDFGGEGYGWINFSEFSNLYRNEDPGAADAEIQAAWDKGEKNGDGQLSWEEFYDLVTVADDHEGMSEDEWRQFFNDIGAEGYGWINYGEFSNGYRQKDPGAAEEDIQAAWDLGDTNGDGQMYWDEFWALVQGMDDDDMKRSRADWQEWFWSNDYDYSEDLDMGEFESGWREEEPDVDQSEVEEAFDYGDTDYNGRLSWGEFIQLVQEETRYTEDDFENIFWEYDNNYDEYMDYGEFENAYRSEEPMVDDDQIWEAFQDIDHNMDGWLSMGEWMATLSGEERAPEPPRQGGDSWGGQGGDEGMLNVEQVNGQTRITLVLGATKLAMSIAMAASGIALAMQ